MSDHPVILPGNVRQLTTTQVQPSLGLAFEVATVTDNAKQKALSQWFTPPDLAERVWRWMVRGHSAHRMRVLEPSAGRGALITPLFTLNVPVSELVAYDVDAANVAELRSMLSPTGVRHDVRHRDFLADADAGSFDISVLNPPYEDNKDVAFAERCLDMCTWVAGIFAVRMLFSASREPFWRWTDIRRMAVLSGRPKFGGGFTPMTDFCVLELGRRKYARKQGDASSCSAEWWP